MVQRGLVSVLVPLYNEEASIAEIVSRAMGAALPAPYRLEIVVVDDGSTDRSAQIAAEFQTQYPASIHLVRCGKNRGKGAAVRAALSVAQGEFSIIQDADLEYHPRDYVSLLTPLINSSADVVYGSRFAAAMRPPAVYFWHSVANRLLTWLTNIFSGLKLTDVLTGYKAFRTALVKTIPLEQDRFAIEPELTMKLAKREAKFCEVPISYQGRTYAQGKKVRLKDAFEAVGAIVYYWIVDDLRRSAEPAETRSTNLIRD